MKSKKTLITYLSITLLLSLLSLISFKNKGNDFFTATSSITADFTLIISVITITYSIFYCCNYFKEKIMKKNNINKFLVFSLLILLLTMSVIFISFVNIFAHKNIFEYIINTINKKENLDIIKLFIESTFIYFFIFLCAAFGIMISNKYDENENMLKYLIILTAMLVVISIILVIIGIKLIYFMIIINITIYVGLLLIWNNKKRKQH